MRSTGPVPRIDAAGFRLAALLVGGLRPVYGGGGLCIITLWRGASLVAALPLTWDQRAGPLSVRCLRFISTGEAEYEEPVRITSIFCTCLVRPLLCAAGRVGRRSTMAWDTLELLDLPQTRR